MRRPNTFHSYFPSASSSTPFCSFSSGQLGFNSLSLLFLLPSDEFYEQCQQLRGHQASAGPTEPGKHQLPVHEPRGNVKAHLLHLRGPLLR